MDYTKNYEYRSSTEVFGFPLLHIAMGCNPETGQPRVAKGIIAMGDYAIGVVALGGFTFGLIAIGGIGLGLLTIAGIAFGALAIGGIAIGHQFAFGGLAASVRYAVGAAEFYLPPLMLFNPIQYLRGMF
jgi:hypothetical protein